MWLCCFCLLLPARSRAETIYVRLLVDEEERTVEHVWQHRLKDRLDAASAIINSYCDIRFAVAEFSTWRSDNNVNDLSRSLREFEMEVDPAPGQIAIGFSSQYRFHKGINGLGGTPRPIAQPHLAPRQRADDPGAGTAGSTGPRTGAFPGGSPLQPTHVGYATCDW